MACYPVLLSIPHGGDQIPPEVAEYVSLTEREMLADGDVFTREIYGIREKTAVVVDTPIARAFIDLNRAATDLPPGNPDGVIKSHTCHGVPVYRSDIWNDGQLVNNLIEKYYFSYHHQLQDQLERYQQRHLVLMLDCHSMEAVGPKIAPDSGVERPSICLGNRSGKSCDTAMTQHMAQSLRRAFELSADQITINKPFAGGYITRHYGNKPVPCLQIELNRGLYLDQTEQGDWDFRINPAKTAEMREKFSFALELFFS